jgi:hypothetical protein
MPNELISAGMRVLPDKEADNLLVLASLPVMRNRLDHQRQHKGYSGWHTEKCSNEELKTSPPCYTKEN